MRVIVWVLIFIAVCCFVSDVNQVKILKKTNAPRPPLNIPESSLPYLNNFTQYLNHFDLFDNRTFQMRYWTNGVFYRPGGPIFIFIGGEWDISLYMGYVLVGNMYEMARKSHGIMYHTEHRFYGKSQPFSDLSTEHLHYLTSDQALADLAYFIENRKMNISGLKNSKVVVLGASYSGTLAIWMRLRYPHLVDAALSSGAPVVAIEEFYQYYNFIGQEIYNNSESCWNFIAEAVAVVDLYLRMPGGVEEISTKFNTCELIITTEPHRAFFFNSITEAFASLVQYDTGTDIRRQCENILKRPGTVLDKLAAFMIDKYDGECMGNYDDFIEWYKSPEIPQFDMSRLFYYQCCTEFGYWQVTNTVSQPFGDHVTKSFYQQLCKDMFGEKFTSDITRKGIEKTNSFNGGLRINVTHVVSIHGSLDPWHTIGITSDMNRDSLAILIEGSAHCADLNVALRTDPPELKVARKKAIEHILKWIR